MFNREPFEGLIGEIGKFKFRRFLTFSLYVFRQCWLKYGLSEAWEAYKKLSGSGSSILAKYEPVASHGDLFGCPLGIILNF